MIDYIKDICYLLKCSLITDLFLLIILFLTQNISNSILIGFIVAITLMMFNFIFMIKTSILALSKSINKAKQYVYISYFFRMLIIFIVLSLAFWLNDINPWIIILHLFYPKVFLFLKIIVGKED